MTATVARVERRGVVRREDELEATRASWDRATATHNAHKGDQVGRLLRGEELLFPEELELLGDLRGRSVVHLQCNSGQDTVCLARRGARVHGVDFSGVAIDFARELAARCGAGATFEQAEVLRWLRETPRRFDVAFASYGVTGWHPDVDAWMAGVSRMLQPGGQLVYVEFHPLIWSFGKDLGFSGDDYFSKGPYVEPVGDYVAESGSALSAPGAEVVPNDLPAYGYQHTLGEVVTAVARAGMELELLREHPHSNGYKAHPSLVLEGARRWVWPPGRARVPLMFSLSARVTRERGDLAQSTKTSAGPSGGTERLEEI